MSQPTISWTDLSAAVQTGDVFLFHGDSLESETIENALGGKYSHSGMAVRTSKGIYIWQTGPDPITEDQITHSRHGGAQLGVLKDTLEVELGYGDTPYWRQLTTDRSGGFESEVWKAMAALDGTPFPGDVEFFADYLLGRRGVPDPTNTMFCSELVASTYMAVGLLGDEHPANYYSPESFSSAGNEVTLTPGSSLGVDTLIDLAS